jgi:lysophospholipase
LIEESVARLTKRVILFDLHFASARAPWHRLAMELFAIPDQPIPSNPIIGSVVTKDGLRLRFARWRPTVRRKSGTVCIIQGRSEFIEKYYETIADLRRRGFAVLAFDFRGQGGSDRMLPDPRMGHVDDFNDYCVDIQTIIEKVMLPSMPKPYFALAHSMGASALLLSLHKGEERFERVALLAPLVRLANQKFLSFAKASATMLDFIALGTSYVPGGGATSPSSKPFENNLITSDPVRFQRIRELIETAPHLGLGDPTIRWAFAMFQMFDRFAERDFGRKISVPSLMVLPGSDPLCSTSAAEALASRLRACQPIIIPSAKHEILTEQDLYRKQFFAAFDAFIPGETQVSDLLAKDEDEEFEQEELALKS